MGRSPERSGVKLVRSDKPSAHFVQQADVRFTLCSDARSASSVSMFTQSSLRGLCALNIQPIASLASVRHASDKYLGHDSGNYHDPRSPHSPPAVEGLIRSLAEPACVARAIVAKSAGTWWTSDGVWKS